MPQISPMKWMILNFLTQSSILQIISFLSMTKSYSPNMNKMNIITYKLYWKW